MGRGEGRFKILFISCGISLLDGNWHFFILSGSQVTHWSNDIKLYDGHIDGKQIEFKSFYNPGGYYQYQYYGMFNEAMDEISGTVEGIFGSDKTGPFTATKN